MTPIVVVLDAEEQTQHVSWAYGFLKFLVK